MLKQLWRYGRWGLLVGAIVLASNFALLLVLPKLSRLPAKADAIIVLGAAINTPTINQRSLKALELYEQGKADAVVASGGKIAEADISEAAYMGKYMNRRATQPVNVILEQDSHDTYANIFNSKRKLPDAESVIIVSDEFHLARAVLLAKRAGFAQVYWAAPNPEYYSQNELRFYYVREFFALLAYIPKFVFG